MLNIMTTKETGGAHDFQVFLSRSPNFGMLKTDAPKATEKKSTEYFGIFVRSLKSGTKTTTSNTREVKTINLAHFCNAGMSITYNCLWNNGTPNHILSGP
jgi:hypothetical protein